MNLRKIILYSCCAIVIFSTTSFKGKVKFATMYITRQALIDLDSTGKSLYFNSSYDNRWIFAKDRVYLVSYSYDTLNSAYGDVSLETVKKHQTKLHKDMKFSVYSLPHDTLHTIISTYRNNPKVFYFILEPVLYEVDNQYVSYQIVLGDQNKMPLETTDLLSENTGARRKIKTKIIVSENAVSEIFSPQSGQKAVVGRLDPSPPAPPR